MREGIHPEYYQAKVICNCGNTKCHPFYTGQQKSVAARGAIDKFNRKYGLK